MKRGYLLLSLLQERELLLQGIPLECNLLALIDQPPKLWLLLPSHLHLKILKQNLLCRSHHAVNNGLGDCGKQLASNNLQVGTDVVRDPLQVSVIGRQVVVSLLKQKLAVEGDECRLGAGWVVAIALSLMSARTC